MGRPRDLKKMFPRGFISLPDVSRELMIPRKTLRTIAAVYGLSEYWYPGCKVKIYDVAQIEWLSRIHRSQWHRIAKRRDPNIASTSAPLPPPRSDIAWRDAYGILESGHPSDEYVPLMTACNYLGWAESTCTITEALEAYNVKVYSVTQGMVRRNWILRSDVERMKYLLSRKCELPVNPPKSRGKELVDGSAK